MRPLVGFNEWNISVNRKDYEALQADSAELRKVLEKIKMDTFTCMEGAGLPEFNNYERWYYMAHRALKK